MREERARQGHRAIAGTPSGQQRSSLSDMHMKQADSTERMPKQPKLLSKKN